MMASTGKLQPVRISELLGLTRSDGKTPVTVPERKRMEPVRIKQLMESISKSCSRKTDAASRPTFLVPGRGARRKLYDRSPSPKPPPPSRAPKRGSIMPRPSLLPQKTQSSIQSSRQITNQARSAPKPPAISRKSFLLPPNTIVKEHLEKTVLETSLMEKSVLSVENPSISQLPRPTVIICAESTRKQNKRVNKEVPKIENFTTETDLEKSLENKENIPPPPESAQPLSEKSLQKLSTITPDLSQRLEKIETDMENLRIGQIQMLTELSQILEIVKSKENVPVIRVENADLNKSFNKENVNSGGKKRRSRSTPGERRRSARLANKMNESVDSFLQLEEELDIKPSGKSTKVLTPGKRTPVNQQNLRRKCKSERAMREYLAIKASMSYLETPDAGRFKNIQDNTPSGQKTMRRSISRKVFDELQDLYSEEDDLSNKIK